MSRSDAVQERAESGLTGRQSVDHGEEDAQARHAATSVTQIQQQAASSSPENTSPASACTVDQSLPASLTHSARQGPASGQEADSPSTDTGTTISQGPAPPADAESPPTTANGHLMSSPVADSSDGREQMQVDLCEPQPACEGSLQQEAAAEDGAQGRVAAWKPVADFSVHSITEVACMKLLLGFVEDMAKVVCMQPCAFRTCTVCCHSLLSLRRRSVLRNLLGPNVPMPSCCETQLITSTDAQYPRLGSSPHMQRSTFAVTALDLTFNTQCHPSLWESSDCSYMHASGGSIVSTVCQPCMRDACHRCQWTIRTFKLPQARVAKLLQRSLPARTRGYYPQLCLQKSSRPWPSSSRTLIQPSILGSVCVLHGHSANTCMQILSASCPHCLSSTC